MRVSVCCTPREGHAVEIEVDVAEGATLADALRVSGVIESLLGGVAPAAGEVGIWGRAAGFDARLAAGDRVEVWRPLAVDPKEARRRRAGGR